MFLIVHTGDGFNVAIEQIGFVKDRYPDARIAIVSDNYRPVDLASAFRAGANGYFVNVNSCDAFIKSVELVIMGETVFPPAFLSFALDANRERELETAEPGECEHAILAAADETILPQLSPREKAILSCLIEGDSNKCVARKINIAEATVKVHVKAILRKIRVQNRTQAAIWGMNHGSLVRSTNGRVPPAVDAARGIAKPIEVISEMQQLNEPSPLAPDSRHVVVPAIDGLLRKGVDRGARAAVRLYK
ncbi:LuxR C-terminal-related transcriptional regulator [Bradyrhizobium diazoefficiens]|uniref:LuxR C-terminal-related transcriptional regulator n=1 Tax=Bradyrhizobium diazoefficiens TaxID=1355477 RepID=UPI00272D24BB|nr:response regulator transcription factor [Bradyrhizobium diazoefficiens]WLA67674.1 response regulator transcription factor [Bradyrhizobium diazoefficiens]